MSLLVYVYVSSLVHPLRYLKAFFLVVQRTILNLPSARTMPRLGHQNYEEEMILKGHGFPVWFADPYDEAEIEIGDIGYMRSALSSALCLTNSVIFQRRNV